MTYIQAGYICQYSIYAVGSNYKVVYTHQLKFWLRPCAIQFFTDFYL